MKFIQPILLYATKLHVCKNVKEWEEFTSIGWIEKNTLHVKNLTISSIYEENYIKLGNGNKINADGVVVVKIILIIKTFLPQCTPAIYWLTILETHITQISFDETPTLSA